MKSSRRTDRACLLRIGKAIAHELRARCDGTRLRIRQPKRIYETETDGWAVTIGRVSDTRVGLEIWYDRYAGHTQRKFNACFFSEDAKPIRRIVPNSLWPIRELTDADYRETDFFFMKQRPKSKEFNAPVLENYDSYHCHFFGFYDPTMDAHAAISQQFSERAVASFLDVATSLSGAATDDAQREVYPCCENRRWVKAHLSRERSRLLAAECKIRDGYLQKLRAIVLRNSA